LQATAIFMGGQSRRGKVCWVDPSQVSRFYFNNIERHFDPSRVEAEGMKTELDLGRLLGRREAFSVVAARCSAADATLRDIRIRLFEGTRQTGSFLLEYLHISKTAANRLIQLLNEFGPQYFEIAQLTRISPKPIVRSRRRSRTGRSTPMGRRSRSSENGEGRGRSRTEAGKPAPTRTANAIASLRGR
jgi:hypothetical protein